MKDIDFSAINYDDRRLQSSLRSFLKKALKFKIRSRYVSAEAMIMDLYKILRRYNIRYARYAIKQYLASHEMATAVEPQHIQNIFVGFKKD